VHAVLGAEQDGADADRDRGAVAVSTGHPTGQSTGHSTGHPTGQLIGHQDLVAEREVWRVEAARGMATAAGSRGVFDLVFDWAQGSWQLTRCVD
jgi:hypothetical protein